jgi:hypothetical protein
MFLKRKLALSVGTVEMDRVGSGMVVWGGGGEGQVEEGGGDGNGDGRGGAEVHMALATPVYDLFKEEHVVVMEMLGRRMSAVIDV